jgi:protoporphyrinogen oxidase
VSPDESTTAVIGAGIAGLTAAWELAKAGRLVTVYEADSVPGGLMASFPFGGTQLDRVYHHIFLDNQPTLGLLAELGLRDDMQWTVAPSGYFHDGQVWPLGSAWDLLRFKPLSLAERVRFGVGVLRAQRVDDWEALDEQTARDWLTKVFGRRVYEVMWEPLLRSKFGDAHDRVSAAWFWYKLRQRSESRHGKSSRETLGYLRGSFGRLATALADAIEDRDGRVALAEPVEELACEENGGFRIRSQEGEAHFQRVLATVAPPLLLQLAPNLPGDYRDRLGAIDYMANLCVVLALEEPLTDIYWLNIGDQAFPFGGIIEHTNLVSPTEYGGLHAAYITRYLRADAPEMSASEDELLDRYEPFLKQVNPSFHRGWVREMHAWREPFAQPVCPRGYRHVVPALRTPVPELYLATMSQIYPEDRGINCGVVLGQRVAQLMLADERESEVPA